MNKSRNFLQLRVLETSVCRDPVFGFTKWPNRSLLWIVTHQNAEPSVQPDPRWLHSTYARTYWPREMRDWSAGSASRRKRSQSAVFEWVFRFWLLYEGWDNSSCITQTLYQPAYIQCSLNGGLTPSRHSARNDNYFLVPFSALPGPFVLLQWMERCSYFPLSAFVRTSRCPRVVDCIRESGQAYRSTSLDESDAMVWKFWGCRQKTFSNMLDTST